MEFTYLMSLRYSEFDVNFRVRTPDGDTYPYVLPNFRQTCPRGWLPGVISEWDHDGIHYEVTYIVVPNEPQPIDLVSIVLRNTADDERRGGLSVILDAAPSLTVDDDLIEDRGKPLAFMDPIVDADRVMRESGCLDPRARCTSPWHPQAMDNDWSHCRVGWYGMPVEYLVGVEPGGSLRLFLGFQASSGLCDGVRTTVEGAPHAQEMTLQTSGTPRMPAEIQEFVGTDVDGDGYIKIAVEPLADTQAHRSVLNLVRAFETDVAITREEVMSDQGRERARHWIDVGGDHHTEVNRLREQVDPSVFALRLPYEPTLAQGEERQYVLKFPAIDRESPAWCAASQPPYDTRQSWRGHLAIELPEGDLTEYAVFGPKPRELWDRQVEAVRGLTWPEALGRVGEFWESFAAEGACFHVPDRQVEDVYNHQLALMELYVEWWSPHQYCMQMNGAVFYWEYSPRDAAYENVAWDVAGFPDRARPLLETILTPKSQLPPSRYPFGQWDDGSAEYDGAWQTRVDQWDAQGQSLWAIMTHYRVTGDREWLEGHYEAIRKGAEWIIRRRRMERERIADTEHPAFGLMPMAGDEPPIGGGHAFYVDAYALLGLREAARAARDLAHIDDADGFDREAADLESALQRAMFLGYVRLNDFAGTLAHSPEIGRNIVEGMSPPHLKTDFGGAMVWPTEAVTPRHPLIEGFYHYREHVGSRIGGLMDWPCVMTDYAIGCIRRGEADRAVDLFCALIASSAGTNDWAETARLNQTFDAFDPPRVGHLGGGDAPHGWAAANFIILLRNMLLHEEDGGLHIAPATLRRWLAQPEPIVVEDAPSFFGPVSYRLAADPDQTTIRGRVRLDPDRKPDRLWIHVRGPGGRGLRSVTLNDDTWKHVARELIVVPDPPDEIRFEATYAR